jgi:hypothetical protein
MHGVKGYSTFWEAMCLRYYEYIPGVNQPEEKDIGDDYGILIGSIGSEKLAAYKRNKDTDT